jgi:hypothetical protein
VRGFASSLGSRHGMRSTVSPRLVGVQQRRQGGGPVRRPAMGWRQSPRASTRGTSCAHASSPRTMAQTSHLPRASNRRNVVDAQLEQRLGKARTRVKRPAGPGRRKKRSRRRSLRRHIASGLAPVSATSASFSRRPSHDRRRASCRNLVSRAARDAASIDWRQRTERSGDGARPRKPARADALRTRHRRVRQQPSLPRWSIAAPADHRHDTLRPTGSARQIVAPLAVVARRQLYRILGTSSKRSTMRPVDPEQQHLWRPIDQTSRVPGAAEETPADA